MTATAVVRIEAPAELEDELVAELWSLGCEGSWSENAASADRIRIHAFFARAALPGKATFADRLARNGVVLWPAEGVPERDWLADWRSQARPIAVGERFLVDPREPAEVEEPVDAGDRWLLRLPARTAFGVGSHESTALAVELLESLDVAGARVLDVGTGTGILALAALRLGAGFAVALDIDPAAALLLPSAAHWNRVRLPAFAGSVEALQVAVARHFDLALINVVPSEIAADLPRLASLLRPRSIAVFSGILSVEADSAARRLSEAGFRETRRRQSGEWSALAMELAP